jgi:hypothetical protein
MKRIDVLMISMLVIALLAVPVFAQTSDGPSSRIQEQPAATVEGSAPQAYSNYFYFFTPGTAGNSQCWRKDLQCGWEHHYADGMFINITKGSNSLVFIDLPITQVASYSGTHPKVRYATVQMYNTGGSTGGYVSSVQALNGGTYLTTVSTNWYTSSQTPTDFTLDLGGYYDMVRGMNMCLAAQNTQTTSDQYIAINGYGAKAEW